jgi:predicted permease
METLKTTLLCLIGVMYSLPLSVAVFLVVDVGMLLIVDFMAELLDDMMMNATTLYDKIVSINVPEVQNT